MDNIENLENQIVECLKREEFSRAVEILKEIPNEGEKARIGFLCLCGYATIKAIDEYGELWVVGNKKEYLKIKAGMGDQCPYNVLLEENGMIETGLIEFINDFISLENPFLRYIKELVEF